jgi:outer membrane protein assembly factor BamB
MSAVDLIAAPAVIPILPAVHSLLVLLLLVGSGLVAGLWALRHPRAWGTLLRFVWSQKWSLLSLAAVLWLAGVLIGRAGSKHRTAIEDAPPVLIDGHWPARGNDRRTGSTTGTTAPSRGAIQWVGGVGYTFYASPAVVGERVYGVGFSGDRSRIFCWDAVDGRQLWTRAPVRKRATFSSPVIDGTRLFVGEGLHHTPDASLHLIDISAGRDGEPLARFPTRSHVEGTPVVADGQVYFTAGDDGVYGWDVRDWDETPVEAAPRSRSASLRWHVPGEEIPDAETAICYHEGRLFVGSGAGGEALVVLDATSGREIARIRFPYPVHGLPSIFEDRMYVGMGTADYVDYASSRGQVSCIDLKTLSVRWSLPLEGTLLGAAACDEAGIVFGCSDGQAYTVDHDGRVQSTWNSRAPILAAVALAGETVLVVNQSGVLYALNRRDLKPLWQVRLGEPGPYLSSPVVAHTRVYVGTPDAGFLCVGDVTGAEGTRDAVRTLPDEADVLWRMRFEGRGTAPPGVTDSMILLASETSGRPVLTGLQRVAGGPPEVAWRRDLDAPVELPIVTIGEIAIVPFPSQLLALDAPTGAALWRVEASTQSAPVIDGERIWIDAGRDAAVRWRPIALADGKPIEVPAVDHPPPTEGGGIIWQVDGGVLRLQRQEESMPHIWCDLSDVGEIVSEPVVAAGQVLVMLSGGDLVALGRAEAP